MTKKAAGEIAAVFTKEQFLQSKQWVGIDKDVLSVVLEDGRTYTLSEAKRLFDEFNKGEVK